VSSDGWSRKVRLGTHFWVKMEWVVPHRS
jgi:hypothetical protein